MYSDWLLDHKTWATGTPVARREVDFYVWWFVDGNPKLDQINQVYFDRIPKTTINFNVSLLMVLRGNQIWSESSLTSSGRNWRGSDKHGLGKWPFWWEKDLWRGDRQCSSKVRFPSICVFTCIYCQYPANCHNLYAMVHYQFPITNHLKFSWLLVKPWFWIVELPSLLVKSACCWLKPHVCWLFRHLLLVETTVLLVKPRCFGGWTPHVCWLKPQVCCLNTHFWIVDHRFFHCQPPKRLHQFRSAELWQTQQGIGHGVAVQPCSTQVHLVHQDTRAVYTTLSTAWR